LTQTAAKRRVGAWSSAGPIVIGLSVVLAVMLAAALLFTNGCTTVQPSDIDMFLRDFLLQTAAAFLFLAQEESL
jgi:hypothetical protein